MGLRRLALGLLTAALAVSATALPAAAKGDVRATLTTAIRVAAPPGTEIDVAWRLFSVGDDGRREPFGPGGVFVRLKSASGGDASQALARHRGGRIGEYEATLAVPDGGIGDLEIGLVAWQSDPAGTRQTEALFPITNEPRFTASAIARRGPERPPPSERPATDSSAWSFVLPTAGVAALAALAVALAVRRRRGALERGA